MMTSLHQICAPSVRSGWRYGPAQHRRELLPQQSGRCGGSGLFAGILRREKLASASFYCDFRKRSTSRAAGIEGCAPTRVTEIAATAEAYRAACTGAAPDRRLTANPALNASPAAVESTAFTVKAGIISHVPPLVARKTPCSPILITTFFGPCSKSRPAQRAAVSGVIGSLALRPHRTRVSLSFGVIHVVHCSNPLGSSRAGAGSSINGILFL